MDRPVGDPGLKKTHALNFKVEPRQRNRNLPHDAVAQGSIDLAAGDSTDGSIDALNLIVLNADRRISPRTRRRRWRESPSGRTSPNFATP